MLGAIQDHDHRDGSADPVHLMVGAGAAVQQMDAISCLSDAVLVQGPLARLERAQEPLAIHDEPRVRPSRHGRLSFGYNHLEVDPAPFHANH